MFINIERIKKIKKIYKIALKVSDNFFFKIRKISVINNKQKNPTSKIFPIIKGLNSSLRMTLKISIN